MKSIVRIVGIVGLLFAASVAMGAEFSADVTQTMPSMPGQPSANMDGKIYVKGKKIRREFTASGSAMPTGMGMGTMIIDMETGVMIMLQPKLKTYMVMPRMGQNMAQWANSDEDYAKMGAKRTLVGSEKVNGYKCDKYLITFNNPAMGKTTQWYSKKLACPIKVVTESAYGGTKMQLKNIKIGKIKDSLFKPPASYKKMEMPGMGGQGMSPGIYK